jgi:tetratricopeptide (TPR) repeat protein
MTQPETTQPVPDEETHKAAAPEEAAAVTDGEAEAEPEPEPWTPERVLEWNAYYDIYVMLAVLLLAFIVAAVRINTSAIWSHLKAGELIAAQAAPLTSDPFSYSQPGARWVDVPWLFQLGHASVFKLVRDLVPTDPVDPTANRAAAEQIAVGVLIALNALARLLTAYLLLRIRRPGPGLWWTALCATIALGAILGPFGVVLGGLAGPGVVGPSTWGLLLLALEMLLLHRAYNEGRRGPLYGLVPLFLLWANLDDSFFLGLLILAAAVIGRILDGPVAAVLIQPIEPEVDDAGLDGKEPEPVPVKPIAPTAGLAVLGLCAAVCLANPSTFRIFAAVLTPVFQLFGPETDFVTVDQLSYFGKGIRQQAPADWYWWTVSYLLMVAAGLASFLLNAQRFAWSRFLPFAVASVCWGVFIRFGPEFAIVFATVLSLNGQEWYQDRFGVRGRLGAGWTAWSTGGRLITLAALFFFVAVGITGWRKSADDPRFGFSFDANEFPFEAAEYLARREDIKGNVLNTTISQGDALIWKAYPTRKTFLDGRAHLFPRELLDEHHQLRNALRDDDVSAWKPELDKYGITAVMIESSGAPNTYRRLMQSPNWIPFYDDGRVVMFGRADAAEPDLTAFRNNRLEPDLRAFKVSEPVPSADRPPTPTSWIDEIFQNRLLGRPQSHTNAANRWLQGASLDVDQPVIPDPARCLLAIREARTALAKSPDDFVAYRLLNAAYRLLTLQETAILGGIPLTPENQARISRLNPNIEILNTRFRQRVTALNYAIQTTPPPRTPEARRELQALNLELFQLFLQAGYNDLARDRLQLALEPSDPSDYAPEQKVQLQQQLDQLNQRVKQIEDNLIDLQAERQAGPIEKAGFARSQGAPGLALAELEEADRGNMGPAVVKPQLVDLYCNTGQPDKALELLTMGAADDPNLGMEPGMSFFRQGQVYLLLGNYLSAASLWQERAIPRLRYDRSMRALSSAQVFGHGDMVGVVNNQLMMPTLLSRQAIWEFELGQCLLESGAPDRAADYFGRALKLVPDIAMRPIIAYYLEKMGQPVPALPAKAAAGTPDPAGSASPGPTPTPEPAKPAPTEKDKGAGPAPAKDAAKPDKTPKPKP